MKNILLIILVLISTSICSQELTTIKVFVPNETDKVYIVGNQESLGNWNPANIEMRYISKYEREITLKLTIPASFKFTRGSWDTEGITTHLQNNPNTLISAFTKNVSYTIKGWADNFTSDFFKYPFQLQKSYSEIFKDDRTIAISLPENYDPEKKYSVIYVLDANTLLEPVLINSSLLSKSDNIPEVIIIGIYHNQRDYEVKPNLGYNSTVDEHFLLEGTEKFKNYLFNELIPTIDKRYKTSKYNSIIGHSDTGHFVLNLPFQESNPFSGIVALSVNSESDFFKKRVTNYLKNSKETIFLGYGNFDNGFKELAVEIDLKIRKEEINNSNMEVAGFNASHTQLSSLAIPLGLKFLFKEYQNYTNFIKYTSNIDIEKYVSSYILANEKYGKSISFTTDNIFALIEISLEKKDVNLFRKIADYASKQDDKIEKHLLFYFSKELNDLQSADKYLNDIIKSTDLNDYELVYSNLEYNYLNYFLNQKQNRTQALLFIEAMINKSAKYKLEFAYS